VKWLASRPRPRHERISASSSGVDVGGALAEAQRVRLNPSRPPRLNRGIIRRIDEVAERVTAAVDDAQPALPVPLRRHGRPAWRRRPRRGPGASAAARPGRTAVVVRALEHRHHPGQHLEREHRCRCIDAVREADLEFAVLQRDRLRATRRRRERRWARSSPRCSQIANRRAMSCGVHCTLFVGHEDVAVARDERFRAPRGPAPSAGHLGPSPACNEDGTWNGGWRGPGQHKAKSKSCDCRHSSASKPSPWGPARNKAR